MRKTDKRYSNLTYDSYYLLLVTLLIRKYEYSRPRFFNSCKKTKGCTHISPFNTFSPICCMKNRCFQGVFSMWWERIEHSVHILFIVLSYEKTMTAREFQFQMYLTTMPGWGTLCPCILSSCSVCQKCEMYACPASSRFS